MRTIDKERHAQRRQRLSALARASPPPEPAAPPPAAIDADTALRVAAVKDRQAALPARVQRGPPKLRCAPRLRARAPHDGRVGVRHEQLSARATPAGTTTQRTCALPPSLAATWPGAASRAAGVAPRRARAAFLAGDDNEGTHYQRNLELRADEPEYRRLKRWLRRGYSGRKPLG